MWLILLLVANCQRESHHKIDKKKTPVYNSFCSHFGNQYKILPLLVIIISGDFKSVHVLKQHAP